MPDTKTDPETLRETVKDLLRADAIRPDVAPDYSDWDDPPRFRYFLDYDEEADALNVAALATNAGLFDDEEYWTGAAHEVHHDGQFAIGAPSEGLVATFQCDNSDVSWSGVDPDLLGLEIGEELARRIHPRLFERID